MGLFSKGILRSGNVQCYIWRRFRVWNILCAHWNAASIKGFLFGGPYILSEFYGKLSHKLPRALWVQETELKIEHGKIATCMPSISQFSLLFNKKQPISLHVWYTSIQNLKRPNCAFLGKREPTQWILHVSMRSLMIICLSVKIHTSN